MGLLVKLYSANPNANIGSLLRDGARVSEPHPLPGELEDKPLFPSVTYRIVTVQVNYGPAPPAQLPEIGFGIPFNG